MALGHPDPQAPDDPPASSDVFAPLRARYAHWLALDHDQVLLDRDEAADDIRALQLVLRMERSDPPTWHRAIALSAEATAKLCLDPRAAAESGPWHDAVLDYCRGHIRKVTRRARASQWNAVQDLAGVTVAADGTEVRALLPGRTSELDKRVAKLQVGGTDVPYEGSAPAPDRRPVLRMWLPPEPVMTVGKSMAQTGHAAMLASALLAGDPDAVAELEEWHRAGCPAFGDRAAVSEWGRLVTRLSDPAAAWREDRLLAVRDAGFTEIAPGTVTVIAQFVGSV